MCAHCTDGARPIWSQAGLQVFLMGRGANRGAAGLSVSEVDCFQVTGENPSMIKALARIASEIVLLEIISCPVVVLLDIFKQSSGETIQAPLQTKALAKSLLQHT